MSYLCINQTIGVLMLLVLIFFACAVAALRWDEVRRDFAEWSRQRKIKKANRPTRKGLHR